MNLLILWIVCFYLFYVRIQNKKSEFKLWLVGSTLFNGSYKINWKIDLELHSIYVAFYKKNIDFYANLLGETYSLTLKFI